MSLRDRRLIRYGPPVVAVVGGIVCAAALTNSVGNTIATVLIGVGLLTIVIFLMQDMGLLGAEEPDVAPPAESPPGPADDGGDSHDGSGPDQGSSNGAGPPPVARRTVDVPRPDRMRGQRRRLR